MITVYDENFPINDDGGRYFMGFFIPCSYINKSLISRFFVAWLQNALLSFDHFHAILKKLEQNELSPSGFKEMIAVLESENKKKDVDTAVLMEKLLKWEIEYELSDKDWIFLYNEFPILKDLIPGKVLTPLSLADKISESVKGQDDSILKLSLYLYEWHIYWNKKQYGAQCLKPRGTRLIIGETGTGKTYSLATAAKHIDAGLIFIDCSRLVPEGIIGPRLYTEIYRKLQQLSQPYTERGRVIIFLDEFDKLVSTLKVRSSSLNELLVLSDMRTDKISASDSYGVQTNFIDIEIDSFCFILGGAFTGIRPHSLDTVGFKNELKTKHAITREQLIKYGLPKEIVGRIGNIIEYNPLSQAALLDILLNSKDSPLNYYKQFFAFQQRNLELSKEELHAIANAALKEGIGARGLDIVLSSYLYDRMIQLFRTTKK